MRCGELALALRRSRPDPTAVIAHGANPGLVSHLVKRALRHLARAHRPDWRYTGCARGLGAACSRPRGQGHPHRRTRYAARRVRNRRMSSSTPGRSRAFFPRGCSRPSWAGYRREGDATRRRRHVSAATRRSTSPGRCRHPGTELDAEGRADPRLPHHPQRGDQHCRLPDAARERERWAYRPTCHYAYHPCDDAILSLHELQGRALNPQSRFRLMNEEIVDGIDEPGVCSTATRTTPTGMARNCRSRKHGGWRRTRTRRAFRLRRRCSLAWLGDRESAPRCRRGRRPRRRAYSRDHGAVSRLHGRRVFRLDASGGTPDAVPGGR